MALARSTPQLAVAWIAKTDLDSATPGPPIGHSVLGREGEKEKKEPGRKPRMKCSRIITFLLASLLALVPLAAAQIGGRTASEGTFLLEDVEDLDLVAAGVERPWVPEYVAGGGLEAKSLAGSGLELLPGQSPIGALHYRMPMELGYISKSFGVPMPSVPGESTLSHPGDISGFDSLQFLFAFSPVLTTQEFWVVLETYPEVAGGKFPRLMWHYEPEEGSSFQPITIPLHEPTLVLDGDGFSVSELLSQTRFLSFYFYAESQRFPSPRMDVYVDDIVLVPKPGVDSSLWIVSGLNEEAGEAVPTAGIEEPG